MITVSKWITYDEADGKQESIGGLGGFFAKGMRWQHYIVKWREETQPYAEAIRQDVLAKGLRLTGREHQESEEGIPLFSDGTVGRFSYRAWGDLMAAIWSEAENKDYCYMDFYS